MFYIDLIDGVSKNYLISCLFIFIKEKKMSFTHHLFLNNYFSCFLAVASMSCALTKNLHLQKLCLVLNYQGQKEIKDKNALFFSNCTSLRTPSKILDD